MRPALSKPTTQKQEELGFVLPYVLVVIAILAIAGTIAAQRLTKATEIVTDMQERARAEQIFASAEAAATFSLLTGNAVADGYDLSPESPIIWEFGLLSADGSEALRDDAADGLARNLWSGLGELRRYTLPRPADTAQADAVIAYRDVSGLISLNQFEPATLLPILEAAGASRSEARQLIAALLDYTDLDDNRRNNGAENLNYRTRNMPPPANSPLRSYNELTHIMGWAEVMPKLDMQLIKDVTTLKLGPGYRQAFAPAKLKSFLGEQSSSTVPNIQTDVLQQLEHTNANSSQFARLIIFVPRSDGRYQKRVVDIERFLGGVGDPYRRHWVYDSVVLESDLRFYVDPSIIRKDGPLPLNELDHVVHASTLRP